MSQYKVGVEQFLSPPNSDGGGSFYLVQGTDGGLYRMNQVSGDMFKLVNEGDWQILDDPDNAPIQSGLENFIGRHIMLTQDYPADYLSTRLVDTAFEGLPGETDAVADIIESGTEDAHQNFEEQDYNALPEGGSVDDLKEFMTDDVDKLTEELQKPIES